MPYIFPKRTLADGDILDPIDLNEDILPAVELYSGNLNEHNLRGGTSGGLQTLTDNSLETNAYYSFISENLVIDPDFGNTPPFSLPRRTNLNRADRIISDAGWSAIPMQADRTITSVVTTDSNAAVWVEVLLQYAISDQMIDPGTYTNTTSLTPGLGADASIPSIVPGFTGQYRGRGSARIQFALRVDGSVLPWTITGHENPFASAPRGEKPSVAYRIDQISQLQSNAPGPKVEQDSDLGSLGNLYSPVRLGSLINVTAGRHRIEVVARRSTGKDQIKPFIEDDIISVYNRRIFAIQIPQIPRATSTFDSVEVVPFDSESVLSQSAFVNTVDAVRSKLNAVKDGALARAALREVHLPPAIKDTGVSERSTDAVQSITTIFPGWANTTTVGASPGWEAITSTSASVTFTPENAGDTAKILVMADAHVADLFRRPVVGAEVDILAAIGIAMSTNGGTFTVLEDSVVFFNKNVVAGKIMANSVPPQKWDRVNLSIPTMTVVNAPSSTTTYSFQLVACVVPTGITSDGSPIPTNTVSIQRGALSALLLRN